MVSFFRKIAYSGKRRMRVLERNLFFAPCLSETAEPPYYEQDCSHILIAKNLFQKEKKRFAWAAVMTISVLE